MCIEQLIIYNDSDNTFYISRSPSPLNALSIKNFLESVGDYITDICYLACKHKVKLEAAFINAALACEIMEGLASSLYPDMAVQRIALPMVLKAEMMHGMKGLPSPLDWASDVRKNW